MLYRKSRCKDNTISQKNQTMTKPFMCMVAVVKINSPSDEMELFSDVNLSTYSTTPMFRIQKQ